ncbi:hypothetical protein CDES_07800 [Corynebacterium deserti GIMN1.010]|uniref:Uncharacterized protein n=1 Tax=Corynebacterium deserti GIMN1.010 TaxID=931089 RepID=A0A0M4CG99_9CORY|nr:hypothetical protein [Corynebacterium deserti]ALC05965.1 hypothetical protein CDES_07800 [Corynebacterium deserti GIMN1.010]
MNSPRKKRARPQPRPQDVSTDSTVGSDYTIKYSLNEFPRGSLVTRFTSLPSKREVFSVLEQYGIVSSQISDYSVAPVASFRQARDQANDGIVVPSILQAQQRQQPVEGPLKGTERKKKSSGCGWIFAGIFLVIFALPVFTADRAFENGRAAVTSYSSDMGPFERFSYCNDRRESLADSSMRIWGEEPGFFTDRVSPSLLHPANVAYMAGCITQ